MLMLQQAAIARLSTGTTALGLMATALLLRRAGRPGSLRRRSLLSQDGDDRLFADPRLRGHFDAARPDIEHVLARVAVREDGVPWPVTRTMAPWPPAHARNAAALNGGDATLPERRHAWMRLTRS
jgi:hypothetical protein